VNDKVYDGKVVFEAEGDKVLGYAELRFIPKEYPHLSKEAFPEEDPRRFVLEPLDGAFDELKEEFAVDVKDIIGGREYVIEAVVKDEDGNVSTKSSKIPYIREFENLGKLLYDRGIIVGATYYPLYPDPHPWELLEPMAVHPLLGKYDVRDSIIIAKHIDGATGHGINCFFFSVGSEDEPFTQKTIRNISTFLDNHLSSQIKISLLYELPHVLRGSGIYPDDEGLYWLDSAPERVKKDFSTFNEYFFSLSNYLKLEERPVVYLYHSIALRGNVNKFVRDLQDITSLYLISDHAHPWAGVEGWVEEPNEFVDKYAIQFDGWTTWAGGWYSPVEEPFDVNYPKFLEKGYSTWRRIADKYNRFLVPSIIPGFVDLRSTDIPDLPRNIRMFEKELEVALSVLSNYEIKLIRIDTYNEAGEGTLIEPTIEEKYMFLIPLQKYLLRIFED
jgi:hypothetical protein